MSMYEELGITGIQKFLEGEGFLSGCVIWITASVVTIAVCIFALKMIEKAHKCLEDNNNKRDYIKYLGKFGISIIFAIAVSVFVMLSGTYYETQRLENEKILEPYRDFKIFNKVTLEDKISYVNKYIEDNKDSNENIEYIMYRYDMSKDASQAAYNEVLNLLDLELNKEGMPEYRIGIQKGMGKEVNDLFKGKSVPVGVVCTSSKDITIKGYHVKKELMEGMPEGMYNVTVDLPQRHNVCGGVKGEFLER